METMPYQPGMEVEVVSATVTCDVPGSHWRAGLPVLTGAGVTLRELRLSDAASLCALLAAEEVARFISPPPTTIQAFEQFIRWSHQKRAAGEYVCFAIVPDGYDVAVGIFQIQMPSGEPAEWGFAMGSRFWGTGLFAEAAEAVLEFAFHRIGLDRLAARAAVDNGRGNGALRKLGAVCEELIPNGLMRHGCSLDQYYWTLSADDRPRRKIIWELRPH